MDPLVYISAFGFLISLGMMTISLFTTRTVFLFRNKTKVRGILLWLIIALAFLKIFDLVAPEDIGQQKSTTPELSQASSSTNATAPSAQTSNVNATFAPAENVTP